MRCSILLISVSLTILLGSCSFQNLKVINPLQNPPAFRYDDQKGVVATVGIYNPNRVGFTVQKSEISLIINEKPVFISELDRRIHLKARDTTFFPYTFKLDLKKLLSIDMLKSLVSQKKVKVNVDGYVVATKFAVIRKKVPINLTGEIGLPRF